MRIGITRHNKAKRQNCTLVLAIWNEEGLPEDDHWGQSDFFSLRLILARDTTRLQGFKFSCQVNV
jgi:hypothetical protein